jgi:hypothetical protein
MLPQSWPGVALEGFRDASQPSRIRLALAIGTMSGSVALPIVW